MRNDIDMQNGFDPRGLSAQIMGSVLQDEQTWGTSMYYRNPFGFREGAESLWISYDDTDPGLVLRKLKKGYQLLEAFGAAPGFGAPDKRGKRHRTSAELWTPILTHPHGPAEFPADQVKAYRWFLPFNKAENGRGCQSLHGRRVAFPQLLTALRDGTITVEMTKCPECHRRTFFEPWHLARHLQISHQYSPDMVFAIGREMGVDFKRTLQLVFAPSTVSELEGLDYYTAPEPDVVDVEMETYAKVKTPHSQMRSQHAVPMTLGGTETEEMPPVRIVPEGEPEDAAPVADTEAARQNDILKAEIDRLQARLAAAKPKRRRTTTRKRTPAKPAQASVPTPEPAFV